MTDLHFPVSASSAAAARKRWLRGPYSEGISEQEIVEVVPAITSRGKRRMEDHMPVWNIVVRVDASRSTRTILHSEAECGAGQQGDSTWEPSPTPSTP